LYFEVRDSWIETLQVCRQRDGSPITKLALHDDSMTV
jgi:hypothetical protein